MKWPKRPRIITREYKSFLADATAMAGPGSLPSDTRVPQIDGYYSRILKFIPVDIIGAYQICWSLIAWQPNSAAPTTQQLVLAWGSFGILLAICYPILLSTTQNRQSNAPPAVRQAIAGTVAFFAWVYAIGGPFEMSFSWYSSQSGAIVLVLACLSLSYFTKNKLG